MLLLGMAPLGVAAEATPDASIDSVETVVPTEPAENAIPTEESIVGTSEAIEPEPAESAPLMPGKPIGGGDGLKPVPTPGSGTGDEDGGVQEPGDGTTPDPAPGDDEEAGQPEDVPAELVTIYADYEGCRDSSSNWGAQLYMSQANVGAPDSMQVNFSDGTSLTVPRTSASETRARYSGPAGDFAGKSMVSITAEVDTSRYTVNRFVADNLNPCGGEVGVTLTVVALGGVNPAGLSYEVIYVGTWNHQVEASGILDETGVVELSGLRYGGTYDVEIYGPGFETNRVRFEAPPRGGADWVISVERIPATVTIGATTTTGHSVAGASYVVTDGSGNVVHQGTFGQNGVVTFERHLAEGESYTVTAVLSAYQAATQTLVAGSGDLSFSLVFQPLGNAKKTILIGLGGESVDGTPLVAPEGSTWTLTETTSGRTYSGTFSGPVPQQIGLPNAVGSGTFSVEVDAGPAFEPYEGTVTIRGNQGSLYVELMPARAD